MSIIKFSGSKLSSRSARATRLSNIETHVSRVSPVQSLKPSYPKFRRQHSLCVKTLSKRIEKDSLQWEHGEAVDRAPSVPKLLQHLRSKQPAPSAMAPGCVHLVGTGPGDPGLLTWRAVQLMQSAQVVLYDRLVSNDILDLVNDQALMVYVGKRSGYHHKTQDETNELILQYAREGYTVLRLKGGDPNMFGRGGEEMEHLRTHGVSVSTVPGITAAAGVCAALGIPLTSRGVANSATFLTGHSRDGGEDPVEEICSRADERTTLVIYMGLQTLSRLTKTLIQIGLPSDLPAVAVMKGTTPDQISVFAPMNELHQAVESSKLKSPTLVVIGRVVALSSFYPGHGKQAVYGKETTSTSREDSVFNDQGLSIPMSVQCVLKKVGHLANNREVSDSEEQREDEVRL